MSEADGIVYANEDGVATIRFNRPARLNALRSIDILGLRSLLEAIASDTGVRVVVLTGTGRAFSSGEDLNELAAHLDGEGDAGVDHHEHLERFQDLTRLLLALPQPTIAALNGVAVGVGAELALACDLRLAAQSARIGFPEVTRGLLGTNGVFALLPQAVGSSSAAYLLLSGEIVDAAQAERWGLVTHTVDDESFASAVDTLARRIADNSPVSTRLTKRLLVDARALDFESVLRREALGMAACLESTDIREGTLAFLESRTAVYGDSR